MTDAEMSLFESGTGNGQLIQASAIKPIAYFFLQVPVIAIFTKMDGLHSRAFNELMLDDVPFAEAKKQAPTRAQAIFENNYLQRLKEVKHKPRFVVQLRGMSPLVGDTSNPLSHSPLRHGQRGY